MKGAADVGLRTRIYLADGTGAPGATLRLAAAETGNKVIDEHETTLVENDIETPVPVPPDGALLTHQERDGLEASIAHQSGARAVDAVANLTLAPVNLQRGHELRVAFEQADEDADVGGRLLQELVAGETAIALELQDVEAGLVSLLGKAIADPALALAVTKTLREVVGVGNAIRRRMENSLGAAENLKAQRRFMYAQRGRTGA